MIRTRIAPSPTGIPHIGNTRTSLFNYAWAKHNDGKFILRIEDTDRARLVGGAEEKIVEIFDWLGLTPDETYKQSERLNIYKEYAQKLLDKDLAFKDEGAIRFKVSKEGQTSWTDAVGDKVITFENSTQEDFVILKSDGYPTYNFANVIDDHLMEITHTIRGDEFISSTPKHIMLYKAFGWEHPVFVHLPLILGPDKSKLSKRHGAQSVLELRDQGYLPQAVINFMAFLGWTPPSGKELLSLKDICDEFELKDVNLAPPIFDTTKLNWLNGEYIRETQDSKLKTQIYEFFEGEYPEDVVNQTIPLVKERMKTLKDYEKLAGFFFEEPDTDEFPTQQLFDNNSPKHLETALEVVETSDWDVESLQKAFLKAIEENKFNTGEFFMSLRGAIAGSRVTPPIVESIIILGKEEAKQRIQNALDLISNL
ncbi:glutamate--tRNA ligase [Candidatus Microgenomates bacterium]|nr:glutamate--tRNA ligase [Candidatus Microgenomates bacterium]